MFIRCIETSGTVAIGKIEVLRMHSAKVYVAAAVGEVFDCKWWRDPTESIFFGQSANVERAHTMLAAIREFSDFFETGAGGENPKKKLASSLASAVGLRTSNCVCSRPGEPQQSVSWLVGGPLPRVRKAVSRCSAETTQPHTLSICTLAYAAGVDAVRPRAYYAR